MFDEQTLSAESKETGCEAGLTNADGRKIKDKHTPAWSCELERQVILPDRFLAFDDTAAGTAPTC